MVDRKIRVLVVDESAFARKVIRETLSADPRIDVVGIARDGLDALEQIETLKPDVITLDLVMPDLDGVGVLKALRNQGNPPAVVVVSIADESSELGVAALAEGAFDVVHKPTALAIEQLYDLGADLVAKVVAAARSTHRPSVRGLEIARPHTPSRPTRTEMLVIGASTGGPQALTQLIRALPRDFAVPVVIVLHMPPGYTEAFARRLDKESDIDVIEAQDGLALRAGQVVIARAGIHLTVQRSGTGWRCNLDIKPLGTLHRPSVDVLFVSAAREVGSGTLGVLLTGMGNDGLEGSHEIHKVGGRLLTEAESSCVVYGMPRCVFQAGLATAQGPIDSMAALIALHL